MASPELQTLFTVLKLNLNFFLDAAINQNEGVELQRALHSDRSLPQKQVATMAAEIVNLLHRVERLLEPGHLVLADHFLGAYILRFCACSAYGNILTSNVGYTNTKCLCAAVELHIPDILAQGPLNLAELAAASKARPDRLGQILRPLYSNGIFDYEEIAGLYSNNHTSTLLQSDHWTQWHNWVNLYGNQFYDMARGIPASVHEDATHCGAQINYNTEQDMFTYFQKQGWLPQLHRTLGGGAIAQAPGILEDYDWGAVASKTVLDIGGGGGALIASLLRRHSEMRAGVYDLADVIEHITDFFQPGGQFEDLELRVPKENLIAGNFLESVPSFEVYTMKWVLHDWKDHDAVKILKNIRKAIIPGEQSRLVVLESVLSDDRMGRLSRYGDINMMMTANGQERTEKQWIDFATRGGWKVGGIFDLRNAWVKAIELRP